MNRRQFCRTAVVVGGTVVFAPLVQACGRFEGTALPGPTATSFSNPTAAPRMTEPALQNATTTTAPIPTATMRATEDSTMANVALIKTADRADGVRRAIELLGLNPVSGKSILLKPNFNSAHPAPGSTHPDVLRTLIGELNGMGARAITVADRSGMGDTRAVMQQIGVHDLAKELGFDAVSFDELPATDWVVRESKDFHWRRGYAVPKMLLDAECVVQTCNLKTHRFGGHFTLSLKNSVGLAAKTVDGGYNYMNELHSSPYQRHMIAEINTAYTPALIVMDGVEAFVQGGPDSGKKVQSEVVLAGTDRIAVDAVGVAILRLFGTTREVSSGKIFEQEQIARAVELGLGVDSPAKMQILAADAEGEAYADKIRGLLMQ